MPAVPRGAVVAVAEMGAAVERVETARVAAEREKAAKEAAAKEVAAREVAAKAVAVTGAGVMVVAVAEGTAAAVERMAVSTWPAEFRPEG